MRKVYAPNLSSAWNKQKVVIDGFELIHDGNTDIRVKVDDIEGVANQSEGKLIKPGEIWHPPFRLHDYLSFYTSANTSQLIRITIGGYV